MPTQFTLIGFGEAGSTFARAGAWGGDAHAYDVDPHRVPAMEQSGVTPCREPQDALAGSDLVLSLVTAGQALAAAKEACASIETDAIFCDMNSVAPQTKREAGKAIQQAGGRYVDVAVLAPVDPAGLNVPLLISGEDGAQASDRLSRIGFTNIRVVGDRIGQASAIKMIRSVMVKGLEALSDEMIAAAQAAGVAEEVLASLDASWREESWRDRVAYNLERMETHGIRRAEEMEQAVLTLRDLGVYPLMTQATIVRQRAAAHRSDEEGNAR